MHVAQVCRSGARTPLCTRHGNTNMRACVLEVTSVALPERMRSESPKRRGTGLVAAAVQYTPFLCQAFGAMAATPC